VTARIRHHGTQQLARPLGPVERNDGLERFDPLPRLCGVYIDEIGHT
jgi:hypothetical protein